MGSLVGTEKNLNFLGGSHVVSPEGEILLRLPLFEEAVVQVRLEAALLENTREKRPLLRNERICVYREAFAKMASRSAKMGSRR
jgi:predicted amidohydrolase